MAKKTKTKTKDKSKPSRWIRWWESVDDEQRGFLAKWSVNTVFFVVVMIGSVYSLREMDAFVRSRPDYDKPIELVPVNVPEIYQKHRSEIREVLIEAQAAASVGWRDDQLVRQVGEALENVGWVKSVNRIEKQFDANKGRLILDCEYRLPAALILHASKYYLVDDEGVRLPGQYRNDPTYPLVVGVKQSPPEPGISWPGEDIEDGLSLLALVKKEVYTKQITGVSVENHDGRLNPRKSHLEIITTAAMGRPPGRIRWGRPLGQEIEEPTPEQKLATLQANYARYGRIDCNQMWIDVSVRDGTFLFPTDDPVTAQ